MRSLNTPMLHGHIAIPFLPYPYLVKQALVESQQKFNSFMIYEDTLKYKMSKSFLKIAKTLRTFKNT